MKRPPDDWHSKRFGRPREAPKGESGAPTHETSYRRGQLLMDDRKTRFDKLNAAISASGGWVTSVPGAETVTFECLEGSPLPESLRNAGYDVREIGAGQRIIPGRIVQRMTLTSSGAYEAAVEGSTKPIASVVTHAGLTPVRKYQFGI